MTIRASWMLVMVGAMGLLFLQQVWRARGEEKDPLGAWSAAWSAGAIVFIVGRFAQHGGGSAAAALIGSRLQFVGGFGIGIAAVGLLRIHAQMRKQRGVFAGIIAMSVVLCILALASDLLVSGPVRTRMDVTGHSFLVMTPGLLVPLIVPYVLALVIYCYALARRSKQGIEADRQTVVGLAGLLGIAFFNDIAFAAGALESIQLLDIALFAVTVGIAWIAHRSTALRYEAVRGEVNVRDKRLKRQALHLEWSQEELEESDAIFRLLANATEEGVAIHRKGRIVHCNRALEEMLGRPLGAEAESDVLLNLWAESSMETATRVVAGEINGPVEVDVRRADGTTFPTELAGGRATFRDRDVGVLTMRDLTERKRMQARLVFADRVASLGTLAAGVAHEVNNPLSYIRGNLEFIKGELPDLQLPPGLQSMLAEPLADALQGTDRIRDVVQGLKMLSSTEQEEHGVADVSQAIEVSLRMANNEVRHRARLVRKMEKLPAAAISESRLGQVVLNLVVNAAQALPPGRASQNRITVSTFMEEERIVVEVADTGPGISTSDLERIFQPFFTTRRRDMGTGLGLSICRSIVLGAGGDIGVESREGIGTSFRIYLNKARVQTGDPVSSGLSPRAPGQARILIVDDEELVLRTLRRQLKNHVTFLARTGPEAIELCRREHPDLILCDVMMPSMPGPEVYETVRRFDENLAQRFVFMTGGAFEPKTKEMLEATTVRVIEKPVPIRELDALIEETLVKPHGEKNLAPARGLPATLS